VLLEVKVEAGLDRPVESLPALLSECHGGMVPRRVAGTVRASRTTASPVRVWCKRSDTAALRGTTTMSAEDLRTQGGAPVSR
jgi:hypothetical protein